MQRRLLNRSIQDIFDLAIIGGGLTGGVLSIGLANSLHKYGLSMVLCEKHPVFIGKDNRVIALSYGSVGILTKLGLWQDIADMAFPINSLELFLDGMSALIRTEDIALPILGYTIPYSALQRAIYTKLKQLCDQRESLSIKSPFSVEKIQFGNPYSILSDATDSIQSQLILCAQGNNTHLPIYVNYREYATQQRVWVMTAHFVTGQPNRGYWFGDNSGAFLALVPHREAYTAIFSPTASDNTSTCSDYQESIARLTNDRVVCIQESIKSFPITSYQAKERVKGPLVLFGNAAHNMPPLGGQNYNVTLFTIREFQKALVKYFEQGGNINDRSFLRKFIKQTEKEITQRVTSVNYLSSALQKKNSTLVRTHLLGLWLLEHFPHIKKTLFRKIVGSSWLSL